MHKNQKCPRRDIVNNNTSTFCTQLFTNSLKASKSFTDSNYRLVIQFILVTRNEAFDWSKLSLFLYSPLLPLRVALFSRNVAGKVGGRLSMNTTYINFSLAVKRDRNPISLSHSSKNCDETNLCSLTKWWSGAGEERFANARNRVARYFPNRIPCLDNFSIQSFTLFAVLRAVTRCFAFVFFFFAVSVEGNFLDCFFISRLSFCTGRLDRMGIIFSFLRACVFFLARF